MKIETAFHRQKKHRSFLKAQGIERVRLGYSKKINSLTKQGPVGGGWVYRGYTFLTSPPCFPFGVFRFVTLPFEILEKTSFHLPKKFGKIVWHPSEIPRLMSWKFPCFFFITPGNSLNPVPSRHLLSFFQE